MHVYNTYRGTYIPNLSIILTRRRNEKRVVYIDALYVCAMYTHYGVISILKDQFSYIIPDIFHLALNILYFRWNQNKINPSTEEKKTRNFFFAFLHFMNNKQKRNSLEINLHIYRIAWVLALFLSSVLHTTINTFVFEINLFVL